MIYVTGIMYVTELPAMMSSVCFIVQRLIQLQATEQWEQKSSVMDESSSKRRKKKNNTKRYNCFSLYPLGHS